jgi:hypothetical protein
MQVHNRRAGFRSPNGGIRDFLESPKVGDIEGYELNR